MNRASELRIRNNRIRRKQQLRRNAIICLLTFVLVISFSFIFFSFRTRAQSSDEEILYKYYKSVMVEDGDTLWRYADIYGDSQHYDSHDAYIKEVMEMNFLKNDQITSGQYLIIPYYSSEFA